MSSVTSKSGSDIMAPSTTFSYAQAARGRTSSAQSTQATTSPAPTSTTSPSVKPTSTPSTIDTLASLPSTAAESAASETAQNDRGPKATAVEQADKETTAPTARDEKDKAVPVAIRSMTRNSSIKSRNEDDATGSDGRAQSEDRTSKSSASAPYSTEGWESKKQQRKGRKGKGADRDTDNDQAGQPEKAAPATAEVAEQAPAKPELCEAPIPAVNVWERRKEAQAAAAKARVVPALPLANSSNGDVDGMRNGDDSPKSIESKKKSKAPEEADSPSASAAAGSKSLRRSTDSARPGSDQAAKSRPSRGNRVVEKDDKTASAAETPLPPVEDPSLWPTIRSVGEEASKKKTVEKSKEKEEPEGNVEQQPTATTKKSKRDWVTMPYVPSAVFQTPIPHRDPTRSSRGRGGGSAGRGGRESGGARAGTSIDKANVTGNGHAKPGAPDSGDRQRDNGVPSTMRTASLPPKPNRESGDSTAIRDQRKASAPASSDEPKRSPTDAQGSTSSRPMPAERQAGSGGRAPDNSGKEGGTQFGKDHAHPTRERTEGRSDRGRGGYRGRGGGHSGTNGQPHLPSGVYPQAVLPNFPGLGLSNGLPFRQQGPYSPPAQQGPFAGPPFIPQPPPARGNGRGGHRGNAAGQMFGRGSTNGMPMSVKVPVHNTMAPGMEYMTPMTPYGFAPAPLPVFDPTFLDTVVRQIDFYFSVDNLCRDLYLRKNMDSQGLVPLSLIAKFNRMVQLGADMDILRLAVERSENIEMLVGVDDGIERIRRREGWQEFVLPMDQRNPEAQNDGPRGTFRPTTMVQQQYEAQQMFANAAAYGMASPTFMNPNGPEMPYQQYTNGNGNTPAFQPGMGGGTAMNGHTGPSETPLSAAVPEFSPNPNGVESILRAATTFTDEQVDNLSVVVESSKSKGKKPAAPPPQMPIAVGTYHGNGPSSQGNGPPSQGLENGTDGPARSQPNGAHHDVPSAEGSSTEGVALDDATNPLSPTSSLRHGDVVWAEVQQPNEANTTKSYMEFRERALRGREITAVGETTRDMKNLYEFWSHFLVDKFNPKMYLEFRAVAMTDAQLNPPATVGLKNLLKYYRKVLPRHQGLLRDVLVDHYDEAKVLAQIVQVPLTAAELQP